MGLTVVLHARIGMVARHFGGCIFCSERGSGEHLAFETSIENQVKNYFSSYRAARANKFILYFQNFSNTYDSLEKLKMKYDTALNTASQVIQEEKLSKEIVGLDIATRPDCINEEICKLLASYQENYHVSVELGLQTANDATGSLINRGYSSKDFTCAVSLLNQYGIDVIAHIMVGLPNETHDDIANTVHFLNQHDIQGIKIHSTYVVKNTALCKLYEEKKYSPITLGEYLEEVTYIITHMNPNIVIHRISGDAPKELLVGPEWNLHKKLVMNGIFNRFEKENLWQGMWY
ncbi:MAG: TIGR01212 family radical SAM protein [Clostridia bacterium]|nr:TIGR01212 family radical SAM protein [Clostridia bacterium]